MSFSCDALTFNAETISLLKNPNTLAGLYRARLSIGSMGANALPTRSNVSAEAMAMVGVCLMGASRDGPGSRTGSGSSAVGATDHLGGTVREIGLKAPFLRPLPIS